MNKFRSHNCGELSLKNNGNAVHLSGWINKKRDHGGLLFVDLRDHYGLTQCVFDSSIKGFKELESMKLESIIKVIGKVVKRSEETINNNLPTGEIEISVENFSILQIKNFIDTNLTSHIVITKLLLPHFKRIKIGDIIFIGSEAGLLGAKNGSLYCAAKFGLRGFSEALSKDVANKNIRVSIINPGMIRTDFFENLNFEPGYDEGNTINIKDISSTVAYILDLSRNTIVDEINLSPLKKAIKFK